MVVTNGFTVTIQTKFVSERSNPDVPIYFFAYNVQIKNGNNKPAQLLRRKWEITNAFGETETIKGDGVVGKQPRLKPGENFSYTSYCPLKTEFGFMEGQYYMVFDNGEIFKISTPLFKLVLPASVN